MEDSSIQIPLLHSVLELQWNTLRCWTLLPLKPYSGLCIRLLLLHAIPHTISCVMSRLPLANPVMCSTRGGRSILTSGQPKEFCSNVKKNQKKTGKSDWMHCKNHKVVSTALQCRSSVLIKILLLCTIDHLITLCYNANSVTPANITSRMCLWESVAQKRNGDSSLRIFPWQQWVCVLISSNVLLSEMDRVCVGAAVVCFCFFLLARGQCKSHFFSSCCYKIDISACTSVCVMALQWYCF